MDAIPLSRRAILDDGLSDGAYRTYSRLAARAWERGGEQGLRAPLLLSDAQIEKLCNCDRATFLRHFGVLKRRDYLAVNPAGGARHSISFLLDPAPAPLGESQKCDSEPGTAPSGESQKCDSVVVVDSNTESDSLDLNQQQQALSQKCDSPELAGSRLERLLVAGGVWAQSVPVLVDLLAEHEQSADPWYLETHVTTRDVLGWLMDLRDPAQRARRRNPAGLLRMNLQENRRADDAFRPPYVCRNCHQIAPRCTCGRLELDLPERFDALALAEQEMPGEGYRPTVLERWHICQVCWAVPCQCPPADDLEPSAPAPRVDAAWEYRAAHDTPAGRLWGSALGQLQLEIPKSTFETWVRGIGLEAHGDDYVVVANNPYARDWLENRLAGTIMRTLNGLLYPKRVATLKITVAATKEPAA